MLQELKKQVSYFINNKWYMVSLIFAAIAGYGYEIIHTSMGIDDVCIEIYFDDGLGVAIGRWPFYLINKIFHLTDFAPFILEFIAVAFMVFAAILWSTVIRYILQRELPIICYIVFSAMLVDYSLIAEVFVYYLQNGIGIIYCLTAVALFVFYYIQTEDMKWKQKVPYIACMSAMTCLTISFYESAAPLFLFGVIAVMLIDAISVNRMKVNKFLKCFECMFLTGRVLIYGIIGRSVITKICMLVYGIEEYNYRSVSSALWMLEYPGRIVHLIKQTMRDYVMIGLEYYPIGLFVLASVIFVIAIFVFTINKKNLYIPLMGLGAYISIFILSLIQGTVLPYRANQILAVFVALILLLVCYCATKIPQKPVRIIALLLVISVVYNSAFDLNQWFAFEYKRNQHEIEEVHHIAYDLRSGGYDINNKPVVFVGEYVLDEAIQMEYSIDSSSPAYSLVEQINASMYESTPEIYPYTQVLSYSFLDWSITSFSLYEGYNREIIRLFEKEGLSLVWGGSELYEKGVERMEDLQRYPTEGYIKEYDDFILVRF